MAPVVVIGVLTDYCYSSNSILRPTRLEFATGNVISNVWLYFVAAFLSFQYHVQMGRNRGA